MEDDRKKPEAGAGNTLLNTEEQLLVSEGGSQFQNNILCPPGDFSNEPWESAHMKNCANLQ